MSYVSVWRYSSCRTSDSSEFQDIWSVDIGVEDEKKERVHTV